MRYPQLNLPKIEPKLKGDQIWDALRCRYVKHTPEEWVRQHMIGFLCNHLEYSKNLMQSEHTVKYNNMQKRCDIIAFNNTLSPLLIVECKAPQIKLSEDTFYQIAKYNFTIKAPLLILTNGMDHVHALMNPETKSIDFLKELPSKSELESLTHNF